MSWFATGVRQPAAVCSPGRAAMNIFRRMCAGTQIVTRQKRMLSAACSPRETMKNSFTKNQLSLAVACALALGFVSSAARAQQLLPAAERELWTDTVKQVWKNGYGECWHSAFGPPPPAGECGPTPIAQYVAPPAPAPAPYVAPAPAQAQATAPVQVQPAPVVVPPERPRKRDRN